MTPSPTTILANICGVLVQVRPEQSAAMQAQLQTIAGVEIHAASDSGKLVLTVETDDYQQAADTLTRIQTLKGVLSTSLIYHHAEELDVTQSESQS